MENYLIHWAGSKGSAKKDHKYISREWKNGRWQYLYSEVKSKKPPKPTGKPNGTPTHLHSTTEGRINSKEQQMYSKLGFKKGSVGDKIMFGGHGKTVSDWGWYYGLKDGGINQISQLSSPRSLLHFYRRPKIKNVLKKKRNEYVGKYKRAISNAKKWIQSKF